MYGSLRPGVGIDINEEMAAKYPLTEARNGGAYGTDRAPDGTIIPPQKEAPRSKARQLQSSSRYFLAALTNGPGSSTLLSPG